MINIYRIRKKDSQDWYVGQTKHHPEVRMFQHWADRNKEVTCGIGYLMRESLYSEFEVELLEQCPLTQANERENHWIQQCGSLNRQNAVKDKHYDAKYSKEYRKTHPRLNRQQEGSKTYQKAKAKLLELTLCPYCLIELTSCSLRRHIMRIHPSG